MKCLEFRGFYSKVNSKPWEGFPMSGLRLILVDQKPQMSSGKALKLISAQSWTRDNVRSILPRPRGKKELGYCTVVQSLNIFAFHLEINFLESGWRVERHQIQAVLSPVWRFCSLWWFGVSCYLLVLLVIGAPRFIKSKVNKACYQEILQHFILPSADWPYGDADFFFLIGLSTCPQC